MTKIDSDQNNESKNDPKLEALTNPDSDAANKKKKKRKKASICTSYCKFEIVRKTAKIFGMKEVGYTEPWNVLWTDYSVSVAKIRILKGYQRVNHFPGMAEICHKALLAKNLNRMYKLFPKQYNFFPKTWCFPSEYNEAVDYSKKHTGRTYILKPGGGCRGQGILLTKNFRSLPPADKLICQLYLSKPFLVDGLKFDLRVYTLVTSCDPLRIYVYNEGLARFATAPYRKPAGYNLSNCYMHLTNYSVNKYSSTFVSDGECGTKRRISCLNQWLSRNLYDVVEIWSKIDEVIVKTIVSALPVIRHSYQVSFPHHDVVPACFELLGFDILLDSSLNPFVLEVNHSPSFNTDSRVDLDIKEALLQDTFKILNLAEMDTQKILDQDKRRAQNRLQNVSPRPESQNAVQIKSSECCVIWEEGHRGNYRKVYPVDNVAKDPYKDFLDKSSMENIMPDTNSSRVREQVSKLNREQISQRDQFEHLSKIHCSKQVFKPPENTAKPERQIPPKIEASKSKLECASPVPVAADSEIKPVELRSPDKAKELSKHSALDVVASEKKISESKMERMDSKINFVIMTHEDETKNNTQSAEFFMRKLLKRLKESGHMPGALNIFPTDPTTGNIKQISLHTQTPSKKKSKDKRRYTNGDVQKYNYVEEPKLLDITRKVTKNVENYLQRNGNHAKEFTLRFHSRAASEFLKFQKLKLLKKFQDLN